MRHYYVTLCAEYFGNYVDVNASSRDEAYNVAKKRFGVLNVSTVYTERAWDRKLTYWLNYAGKLENEEELKFLRRQKISY